MSLREDISKLEERFEEFEIEHDKKVIAREQERIAKDQGKEVTTENKANDAALDGKTGFFHNEDEKLKADEVRHDGNAIHKDIEKIQEEQKKILEHEAKIAAEKKRAEK